MIKKRFYQAPIQSGRFDASTDRAQAPPPSEIEPAGSRPDPEPAAAAAERFEARPPRATLDRVVLPAETRRQFLTLLSRIRNRSLLYETWDLGRIDPTGRLAAVNFYGPPGTGKTLCVEALASELHRPVVEVSYAEIESKYVGETPKNIREAFRRAAEQDALLFFDEADSILGRRLTNVTQAADQAVNVSRAVMLKQLDEFSGVVAFATNLARNFDSAFVRRILLHVEVAPPDREGRLELWRRMIAPEVPGRALLDWDRLADESEGLAGGEIKNAVVLCLSEVADRASDDRFLLDSDVLAAIADVRRAKRAVGHREPDLTVAEVSLDPAAR